MTISYNELLRIRFEYISTKQMSEYLGITPSAASRVVRLGKVSGIKIGGSYLVSKAEVENLARTYKAHRGRPRKKRRYTRRTSKEF